ncbi:non-homologous end-joining DNA ligase [Streptomyces sp. 6N223]|uniref:non-homologous end-joining DNA ligase n=1 Tax=Streptomyces sp. 6N223 TaxID=3457412 RepID=UPI003FD00A48
MPHALPPDPGTVPDAVAPILATDAPLPAGDDWAYEFKWDGIRCCMRVAPGGATRLTSRNGADITEAYPELARLPAPELRGRAAVLDGEIVALDAAGRPDFGVLQRRHHRRPTESLLASFPVTYFAFDLLLLGEAWLLSRPYGQRRAALAGLAAAPVPHLEVPRHYTGSDATPGDLMEVARRHGLEGLVAKRLDSPYLPGRRSRLWIKKALFATQDVVIGGWQPGQGHRAGTIGSLLLGAHDREGRLRYVGHVGSGFTRQAIADLLARLAPLERADCPFAERPPPPQVRHARWVAPRLVGSVAFRTWTRDGRLRHPVWRGLRPDVPAERVALPPGRDPAAPG